jgi:hypothetical protein
MSSCANTGDGVINIKLEKTVAAGFEAKPLETVATGFEAKPAKTFRVVLRPNHSQTVDLGFKAQTRNSCSSSPCDRCRPHTVPADRPITEYLTGPTIPGPLHQVSYSYHGPYRYMPYRTCHLHTTRQANTILRTKKIKEKQNKTILDSNLNLAKSMTHHNQTKELPTWFLSQRHALSSLVVGATLTQEDFFVQDLTAVRQLGMDMVLHTQSLLIEVITDAFPVPGLRRVVSGLLNAVVVAPSPLEAGKGLLTGNRQQRTRWRSCEPHQPSTEASSAADDFCKELQP